MQKRYDLDQIGMHLVKEAVAEYEDLAQPRVVAFWDDTTPLTQSCERGSGCEGLLEDSKRTRR
jgi:hypothetical protein